MRDLLQIMRDLLPWVAPILTVIGWGVVAVINIRGWRNARIVAEQNFTRSREKDNYEHLRQNLADIKTTAIDYYGKTGKDHYTLMELIDMTAIFAKHHNYLGNSTTEFARAWLEFKKAVTDRLVDEADRIHTRNSKLIQKIDASYKQLYTELLSEYQKRIEQIK